MTTQQFAFQPSITTGTDAWFRAQGQAISDALTALGIPKTADTGQVNWATVTLPAAGATTAYEIRRLNDAYQASDPIFLKITYVRNVFGSASQFGLQIEVGTGSNGSGSLTGAVGTSRSILMGYTTASYDFVMAGDGSGFACIGGATTNGRVWFDIERLRGEDGEPLTGQFVIVKNSDAGAAQAASHFQTIHYDILNGDQNVLGVAVHYPAGLSSGSSSLAVLASNKYPFGILSIPTEEGVGQTKLFVGYGFGDFLHTTEFDLTRFTDDEVCHYRCWKPGSNLYAYGLVDANTAITGSNSNPTVAGTPAIYWE